MRAINLLLCAALLGGCQSESNVNVAANELDVVAGVIDEPNPSDGKHICSLSLKHDGALVTSLSGDAEVKCNGVSMPFNSLTAGFAERVPAQNAGGMYTFTYRRAGVDTTVQVTVPARPHITQPPTDASLSRNEVLTVQYASGGGEVQVWAKSETKSSTNGFQPDSGTYSLDPAALEPGDGKVRMTRKLASTPTNTGFRSARINYQTSVDVPVSWQ